MATQAEHHDPILDRVASALFWIAAFAYAAALFFPLLKLLRPLPPTAPVAVGLVTLEGVSKLRDYVGAAIFFTFVPIATVVFRARLARFHAWLLAPAGNPSPSVTTLSTVLFSLPFFLAPLFYLTTHKELWGVLLPPVLALAAPRIAVLHATRRWFRELFDAAHQPFHALLVVEATAWLAGRYIGTGKRVAHIPTLFLEIVFIIFFIAIFWAAAVLVARISALLFTTGTAEQLRRFALGASPLLLLPLLMLTVDRPAIVAAIVIAAAIGGVIVAIAFRVDLAPQRVWRLLVWLVIPILLFSAEFAATSSVSRWIDLFHRGEALAPASDYLRGKVPFRDVFVLHGMLEDGLLDAWLMQIFGRSAAVSIIRYEILGALVMPALWYLAITMFRSLVAGGFVILLAAVTTTGHQRGFLEVLTATLLIAAIARRSSVRSFLAGFVAAVALFFSLDIGIYSLAGGIFALLLIALFRKRSTEEVSPWRHLGLFAAGVVAGVAPFSAWLASLGALDDFFITSFAVVPSTIDAVWSLPFPDLGWRFRHDLSLRSVADLLLGEPIRFILNPLVLVLALVYLLQRFVRARVDRFDIYLTIVALFALLTQRSALGRADFPHQHFAAFLLPPVIVGLAIALLRVVRPLWRGSDGSGRIALTAIALLVAPLVFVALWIPDLIASRLDSMTSYRARVVAVAADEAGETVARRVAEVTKAITGATGFDEPIFDFSNQPAIYFFANRPNPTRFYQTPMLSPPPLQLEAIRALHEARPRIVVRGSPERYDRFDRIPNELRAPAVADYIDAHYDYWKSVRGIELWRRRPGHPPLDLDRYREAASRRPQRIPEETTQLIFPAVGSVAGAAESRWQSDLLVHHQGEPIVVRLRYLSSSGNRGRRLVVTDGVAIHRDVVGTLLAAPETRGMLVVECAGRCPSLRVRTWDATRPREESFERPLSPEDAASASGERSVLQLTGISGGQPRRVNIGIINTGLSPLRYRLTLFEGGTAVVGRTRESAVAEGESELIVDTERALGAPITPMTLIEIRLLEGSAIAWGSVIDGVTGDHDFFQATAGGGR